MRYRSPPVRVEPGLCPPASPASQATCSPVNACASADAMTSAPRPSSSTLGQTGSTRFYPQAPDSRARGSQWPKGPYALAVRPLLGAVLVAVLLVPVAAACLAIAAAQLVVQGRLDEIFFVQWRAGLHGRPFRILKFRTLGQDGDGNLVPTTLGALLRKSHLDELPQLWNVVRGEMSLIGPRPETLALEAWADSKIEGFSKRLVIRPGITGLAQVVQDSIPQDLEAYREKLRLNEDYLRSMGLRTDLRILVRTALRPLRPRKFHPGAPNGGRRPRLDEGPIREAA